MGVVDIVMETGLRFLESSSLCHFLCHSVYVIVAIFLLCVILD